MTRIGFDELRRLLDAYERPLSLYARQWTDECEDVVQEAFVKLMEQRTTLERPVGWLFRTVKNAALNRRRTDGRRRTRERVVGERREAEGVEQVERVDDRLDAETAAQALDKLSAEEREIVVARVWGGLSFAEIAELADSSASTVFRRYESGLNALRALLRVPCPPNE